MTYTDDDHTDDDHMPPNVRVLYLLEVMARIGQPVTVEGPYGRFTFDDGAERQIWIGGGIGIAPFVARMKALAACGIRTICYNFI